MFPISNSYIASFRGWSDKKEKAPALSPASLFGYPCVYKNFNPSNSVDQNCDDHCNENFITHTPKVTIRDKNSNAIITSEEYQQEVQDKKESQFAKQNKNPKFKLKTYLRKYNCSIPPLQVEKLAEASQQQEEGSKLGIKPNFEINTPVPPKERLRTCCTNKRPTTDAKRQHLRGPRKNLINSFYQTPKMSKRPVKLRRRIINLSDSDFKYRKNQDNLNKVAFINRFDKRRMNIPLSITNKTSLLNSIRKARGQNKEDTVIKNLFIRGLGSTGSNLLRPSTQVTERKPRKYKGHHPVLILNPKETDDKIPTPNKSPKRTKNKINFRRKIEYFEISKEGDVTKTIGVQIKVHNRKQYLSKYEGKFTKRNSSVLASDDEVISCTG
ncbi:unnamed protein product [Moneuplotes crassus]|uniref:Uncharacterized protein n=1 Tax=Euplotes crassus TaxID=5936 RepID=A0AAD1XCU1_EUPCR|nr:unnamed protein product [Moneuplotes crassus]